MSIWPQAPNGSRRVVYSFKFKAPRESYSKMTNGEWDARFAEIFGDMPLIHLGPSDPNMLIGMAALVTQLQVRAMDPLLNPTTWAR